MAGIALRRLLLLVVVTLLGACTLIPAKRVMPIEEGITFYTIEDTPAPTVMLISGCGGMNVNGADTFHPRVAQWLNDNGFNAVVLDYVKIMGLETACLGQIKPDSLLQLLFDALDYTAAQPFVDRDRIALLGWSLGASAALTVAEKIEPSDHRPNITAVAAYYPGCYPGLRLSTRPTLLLLGLADNVVNANECLALASRSPQTPLVVKTYEGAQHNFAAVEFTQPQSARFLWKKFTSAYDPDAAADAKKTLLEFLKNNNGRQPRADAGSRKVNQCD